ncbi:MAG: glycosyltransferase family protein [Breznakibacter sp.]
MKILYAIQGTGNGHLARALEIVPSLQRHADVDILVSGSHCEITLPWPIKYKLHGLGFVFGKKGGIDYRTTFRQFRLSRFIKEARSVDVNQYDLVVNDFEPITAWACLWKRVPCVGLSHQNAVMRPIAPKPLTWDIWGALVLRFYAPTRYAYGFHFQSFDNHTFTPVIREDVRRASPTADDHYTVYLPSYDDFTIIDFLSQFPQDRFEVFSKHNQKPISYKNVDVVPVNKDKFAQSLISSKGVLCNAGFETPAEALYLNKKLCVIPMTGQYEQQCNAFTLKQMGIATLRGLSHKASPALFAQWLGRPQTVKVNYQNQTNQIIDMLIARHAPKATLPQMAIPAGYGF